MTGAPVARVTVAVRPRPYDVLVGRDVLATPPAAMLDGIGRRRTVVLVTQDRVADLHRDRLAPLLDAVGERVVDLRVPDGEAAKSPAVLAELWRSCAAVPVGRGDLVVALGGGVVGDLAGFLAATWNRGIDVLQVPTTLLAQVDAAIGGKTGINLPEGKNLVGAFHQPVAVACDVEVLSTLPERERIAGLGEVVKYALIDRAPLADGRPLLEHLEAHAEVVRGGAPDVLVPIVAHSVAVKARVVAGDERESGARAHLNLGHTHGHAIEAAGGYATHLHGEAVAIGIATALRVGVATGHTPADLVERYERLARRLGLPVRAPALDRPAVWELMARDKKAADGVRFVVLGGIGRPLVTTPSRAVVDEALDEVEA